MATSLTMAARRVATFTRFTSSTTAALDQCRDLAGAADLHGPPKVNCWKEQMNPAQWKEEHFVILSLFGWGLLFYGGYKLFTGGKKNKEENLVQAHNNAAIYEAIWTFAQISAKFRHISDYFS